MSQGKSEKEEKSEKETEEKKKLCDKESEEERKKNVVVIEKEAKYLRDIEWKNYVFNEKEEMSEL